LAVLAVPLPKCPLHAITLGVDLELDLMQIGMKKNIVGKMRSIETNCGSGKRTSTRKIKR
jgi:hypothetical protein